MRAAVSAQIAPRLVRFRPSPPRVRFPLRHHRPPRFPIVSPFPPPRPRSCSTMESARVDNDGDKAEKEKTGKTEEKPKPEAEPSPPEKPLPGDCCGSGCVRCVWDIYYEELEAYNQILASRSKGAFIVSVVYHSYLVVLLLLWPTMPSYPSTTLAVHVVRRAFAGRGGRPYLCQVGCTTTDALHTCIRPIICVGSTTSTDQLSEGYCPTTKCRYTPLSQIQGLSTSNDGRLMPICVKAAFGRVGERTLALSHLVLSGQREVLCLPVPHQGLL
ncbi:hypothetical protein BHM03_00028646 [Ensete ventricosum]|nr:hypothetical protein BHM03_00028646 [Ensete ventricosum]